MGGSAASSQHSVPAVDPSTRSQRLIPAHGPSTRPQQSIPAHDPSTWSQQAIPAFGPSIRSQPSIPALGLCDRSQQSMTAVDPGIDCWDRSQRPSATMSVSVRMRGRCGEGSLEASRWRGHGEMSGNQSSIFLLLRCSSEVSPGSAPALAKLVHRGCSNTIGARTPVAAQASAEAIVHIYPQVVHRTIVVASDRPAFFIVNAMHTPA